MNRFGWWDTVAGPPSELINRFTAERVVMVGPLASGDRPDQSPHWQRFEYRHEALRFPLAIRWDLAGSEIVVDYNLSAAIWKRETNVRQAVPSYETFVQIDDCVIDALLCWPGVADSLRRRRRGEIGNIFGGQLRRLGGYLGGVWLEQLGFLELMRPRKYERFRPISLQQPLMLGRFTPGARAWTYSEVPGGGLSELEESLRTARFYTLAGMMTGAFNSIKFSNVARGGLVPQVRSNDGAGLMYPLSVTPMRWSQNQVPLSEALFALQDIRYGFVVLKRSDPYYFRKNNVRAPWVMSLLPTGNVTSDYDNSTFQYANQMRVDVEEDGPVRILTGEADRFWSRTAIEAAMAWGEGVSTATTTTVPPSLPNVPHESLWVKDTPELSRDLACRPSQDVALRMQLRGGALSPEVIHRVAGILDAGGETQRAFDTYARHLISEHLPE